MKLPIFSILVLATDAAAFAPSAFISPNLKVHGSSTALGMAGLKHALGWRPDLPDFRDYSTETEEVKSILNKSNGFRATASSLPNHEDLSEWCSPVEDQGGLGSCTAQAGVGLLEYYQRRAYDKHIDGSRLFLYKVTRNMLQETGDTGAYLRTVMGAMALFGVPPERYWPYHEPSFDVEPPVFCYSLARNYEALKYYRLDTLGRQPQEILDSVKHNLAAKLPCMFGFTVYSSIAQAEDNGEIPFPSSRDRVEGGHAVVAIGYDDSKKIGNSTGALKIRNSWGLKWGKDSYKPGYGWLPYDYILYGLARDFWAIVETEFDDTQLFAEPGEAG